MAAWPSLEVYTDGWRHVHGGSGPGRRLDKQHRPIHGTEPCSGLPLGAASQGWGRDRGTWGGRGDWWDRKWPSPRTLSLIATVSRARGFDSSYSQYQLCPTRASKRLPPCFRRQCVDAERRVGWWCERTRARAHPCWFPTKLDRIGSSKIVHTARAAPHSVRRRAQPSEQAPGQLEPHQPPRRREYRAREPRHGATE